VDGCFCFLDFRLDLCFKPLDFGFLREGKDGPKREIEERKRKKERKKWSWREKKCNGKGRKSDKLMNY